jgi:hypothetical protein
MAHPPGDVGWPGAGGVAATMAPCPRISQDPSCMPSNTICIKHHVPVARPCHVRCAEASGGDGVVAMAGTPAQRCCAVDSAGGVRLQFEFRRACVTEGSVDIRVGEGRGSAKLCRR